MLKTLYELNWSDPIDLPVRGGRVMKLKKAEPTEAFWDMWRKYKVYLQDAGVTVSAFKGAYTVNWWERNGGFTVPVLPVEVMATDPEIDIDLEPLKYEDRIDPLFRKFQPRLIQLTIASMKRNNSSLNGSGTGVGKTFITLYSALERGRKLLVISPKSVTIKWKRAADKVGVEVVGAFGWEWIKTGKTEFGHWNYGPPKRGKKRPSKLGFVWTVPEGVDLVFDEGHRAGDPASDNSAIVVAARKQALPIYILSATLADSPTKMRATGFALGLHRDGDDFKSWMFRHGVKENRFRVTIPGKFDEKGEPRKRQVTTLTFDAEAEGAHEHLRRIHASIFPKRGVRVTPKELGDAFPPSLIKAEMYHLDAEAREKINQIYERADSDIAALELTDESEKTETEMTIRMKARMAVELVKIPIFVSLTRDALEEGNSVFIAVNFRETLKDSEAASRGAEDRCVHHGRPRSSGASESHG
jgi:hypothetical protein